MAGFWPTAEAAETDAAMRVFTKSRLRMVDDISSRVRSGLA
jgi:hypothetical protein